MINKERKSIRTLTKEDKLSLSKDTDKTQEFFLRMSQRNFIKRHLSPIKTSRDFNFNKDKTAHHYNSYINTMKTDIIQVDKLLHKYSDVLAIHDNSCHNPAFQQRIAQLHTNRNIPIRNYFANILENSQSLEHLYKDFECRTKEDLIVRLSLENYFMNLYLNKLNDLIFVMSLKYYNSNNEYVQGYTESLSRFSHVKFLITRISEDNTIPEESSLLRKESNVSNISVNENGSILSLNNLNDFLNYETKDINLTHLKKLVIEYNHKSSKIFNDFVYFHCKENFTSMKSSDDLMANLIMLRKTIEDKLIQVKDENEKYNEEMTKLREELNKVKQLDLKKDFKDYLDQLDKRRKHFY